MVQYRTDGLARLQSKQAVYENLKRNYALVLILLLGLIIRFVALGEMDIWFDEAVSTLIARNPVQQIISRSPTVTVNPPLYYIILHYWSSVSPGLTGARILSVFFGLMSIIMIYLLGLRTMGPKIALTAALLCAVSPFQVYYSQELRMYSLLSFLSLGTIFSAFGIYNNDRPVDWLGFILFATAGLYTHYFSAITLAICLIALMIARQRRSGMVLRTMACGLMIASLFAPWVPSFLNNAGEVYGMRSGDAEPAATLSLPLSLAGTIKSFSVGNEQTVSLADERFDYLVILPACLIFMWLFGLGLARGPGRIQALLMGWGIAGTVLLVALISLKMHIYLNRYLIIINGPFYLVVARGLAGLERRRIILPATIALILILLNISNFNRVFNPEYRREEFRQAASYLTANYLPGDRVVHLSLFTLYPFIEYHKGITDEYVFKETPGLEQVEGLITYRALGCRDLNHGRVWWIVPLIPGRLQAGLPWLKVPEERYAGILNDLKSAGFTEISRKDFRGIRIMLLNRR